MQSISVQELSERRKHFLVLDVRERWEWEIAHLEGAVHIPLKDIGVKINELDPSCLIAVMCHHGVISDRVGDFLLQRGFSSVYNVEGGIDAWSREIDHSVPVY